ncbi:MAG: hypothetical protein ACR2RV_16870 [Verrucomicrobiales bacterium]
MRKLRRIHAFFLGLALVLPALTGSAQADDDGNGAIPVEDVDRIKAELKKAVIVYGTISESKIIENGGHAVLNFEESELAVFIRKEDLAKNPGWALEALVGLEVYVAGQVKMFNDQLEVVVVGPSQIAASPDGFDLAKIPLPETQKKSGGASKKKPAKIPGAIAPTKKDYPDLPLKLKEASVQTLAFYLVDSGMKIKDDPYGLPVDLISAGVASVTGVVTEREGGGPMQVVFPEPNDASKNRIKAVLDQLAESYGKWPTDRLLTIDVDFDSRGFKDDPPTLAIASLIHSLVTGTELAGNLVISAGIGEDGSTTAPALIDEGQVSNRQILEAISESAVEPVRYVCYDMSTDELNDLALDGDWETLTNVTVLVAPTLQDALQLIFAEPEGELGKALTSFDQTQAVMKKDAAKMVKNSHVQERVIAAGKAWPKNKSAVFYLYYDRGKVPRTYSLPYTQHMIEDIHRNLRFLQISNPPDPKEKFRAYETEIKEMRPKLNPELSKLVRALGDFADDASSSVLRPKQGRAKERQEEKLKDADAKVTEELATLASMIEGGGDVERD